MGNDSTVQYIIVIIKIRYYKVVSPRFVRGIIILQSSYITAVQGYTVTAFKTKVRNYFQSRPPLFGMIAFRTFSDRPETRLNIILNPLQKIWQVVTTELAWEYMLKVQKILHLYYLLFHYLAGYLKKNVVSIYFYLNQNSNETK